MTKETIQITWFCHRNPLGEGKELITLFLFKNYYFAAFSAASMITFATASGWEIYTA
jgi:hypothetical protein